MIKGINLLTQEELTYLRELYGASPKQFHTQDVNLFNLHKSNIGNVQSKHWNNIQLKLSAFHGRKCPVTNYFLEYRVGSYAKKHQDNPDTVDGTAITLIDKSDDLVGGDIVVGRKEDERVLPHSVGQTIYYTTAVFHGVSKVTQGSRIVLITWFRKDTWQN